VLLALLPTSATVLPVGSGSSGVVDDDDDSSCVVARVGAAVVGASLRSSTRLCRAACRLFSTLASCLSGHRPSIMWVQARRGESEGERGREGDRERGREGEREEGRERGGGEREGERREGKRERKGKGEREREGRRAVER
jgi:hypothetical protein